MKKSITNIKIKALPILKQAGVTRSAIFGSSVRVDSKQNSDVDFLIELPKDKNLLEFVDLKIKLQDALKKDNYPLITSSISPLIRKFDCGWVHRFIGLPTSGIVNLC